MRVVSKFLLLLVTLSLLSACAPADYVSLTRSKLLQNHDRTSKAATTGKTSKKAKKINSEKTKETETPPKGSAYNPRQKLKSGQPGNTGEQESNSSVEIDKIAEETDESIPLVTEEMEAELIRELESSDTPQKAIQAEAPEKIETKAPFTTFPAMFCKYSKIVIPKNASLALPMEFKAEIEKFCADSNLPRDGILLTQENFKANPFKEVYNLIVMRLGQERIINPYLLERIEALHRESTDSTTSIDGIAATDVYIAPIGRHKHILYLSSDSKTCLREALTLLQQERTTIRGNRFSLGCAESQTKSQTD